MACASSFSKFILIFLNFVILICACLLVAFGVIYFNKIDGLITDNLFSLGGLAIGIGAVTFVIAFFGCCGAYRESSCLLTTYAIILIALLIAQIVLAVMVFVKIQNEDDFRKEVTELLQKVFNETNDSTKQAFYDLQVDLQCCGVTSFLDYGLPPYPKSCCENQADPCYQPYIDGCATKLADFIEDNLTILGGVAIGFGVIEFIGAAFAFMIRKRGREYV